MKYNWQFYLTLARGHLAIITMVHRHRALLILYLYLLTTGVIKCHLKSSEAQSVMWYVSSQFVAEIETSISRSRNWRRTQCTKESCMTIIKQTTCDPNFRENFCTRNLFGASNITGNAAYRIACNFGKR